MADNNRVIQRDKNLKYSAKRQEKSKTEPGLSQVVDNNRVIQRDKNLKHSGRSKKKVKTESGLSEVVDGHDKCQPQT